MNDSDMKTRLTDLLEEAGQRHHEAYIESDGIDPEWATWYAGYVQAQLWDAAGRLPSRGELTYLLIAAQRAHDEAGSAEPWPPFYARHLLDELRR